MIYTAGDSHAQWTYNCIPGVKVSSISMITMHRVGRPDDDLMYNEIKRLELTSADVLILACGEIDCRAHIKHQTQLQGKSHEEICQQLADSYIARALTFPTNGARVAITSVPPPVPEGKIYHAGVLLPLDGSNAERVAYTTTLNSMLRNACEANGIVFIDVYTPYADYNGLLIPEISDGSVHIRDNELVRKELYRLGLLTEESAQS